MDKQMQAEWFDKVYEKHSNLWLAVDAMLQLMLKSGLPMPNERMKQFALDDPETLGVYVLDIADAGITLDDLMADGHKVRRMLRFFPSSTELVTALLACREKREPSGLILDPVYIFDKGHVFLTRRKTAEKNGWPFWECQIDCEIANGLYVPRSSLPEGKKALAARLDSISAKMTSTDDESEEAMIERHRKNVEEYKRMYGLGEPERKPTRKRAKQVAPAARAG